MVRLVMSAREYRTWNRLARAMCDVLGEILSPARASIESRAKRERLDSSRDSSSLLLKAESPSRGSPRVSGENGDNGGEKGTRAAPARMSSGLEAIC